VASVDVATYGWRFWLVRPGTDLLLSPYDYGPSWPGVRMMATCATDPEHVPPAPGCLCGVYAERTAADACERVDRHKETVRSNLAWAKRNGVPIPPLPSYVVGRVALAAAVPFVPPAGMIRVGDDELRAASAEIVELHVLADSGDAQVGVLLAARYGVPVQQIVATPWLSGPGSITAG
jgi:hypothetical protein